MPDFTKDELRETIADLERLGGPELLLTPSDLGVLEHARFALAQVEALERRGRVAAETMERGEDGIRACKAWHPSGTRGWFISIHERARLAKLETRIRELEERHGSF